MVFSLPAVKSVGNPTENSPCISLRLGHSNPLELLVVVVVVGILFSSYLACSVCSEKHK